MATNSIYDDADSLSLPVASGTKSGDPVRVGTLVGVALTDRANTTGVEPLNPDGTSNSTYNYGGGNAHGNATVKLKGASEFVVGFEVTEVGSAVYITPGGALTAVASGNTKFGAALNTKAATSGVLLVRISN